LDTRRDGIEIFGRVVRASPLDADRGDQWVVEDLSAVDAMVQPR
jgi:hypothetical protein